MSNYLRFITLKKYTFRGKYCKFVTNRSWVMDNPNFCFLSFSMANILKMASGKPYIHELSLITCLLVTKTYMLIKTNLKQELCIILVEIGGHLAFWSLFE